MKRASALLLTLGAVACVDTNPDRVQLQARVRNVDLAVEQTTLVTVLSGQFDLVLDLGDLASGSRVVETAPPFTLVKSGQRSLVRNLDALPDGVSFPVTVDAGESRTVGFVLTSENTLHADQFDSVCAAPVVIAGGVEDSETGRSVPFESGPFTPEGCP